MLEKYLSKNLKDGETPVRIIRRYPVKLVLALTAGALCALTDMFFFVPLVQFGTWGMLGFLLVLVLAALGMYRAWFIWSMNALVVTDLRIIDIDQRGFFHRVVSETTFSKIQDVSYAVRGLWATLFGFGTVTIQTAGTQAKIEIDTIRNPAKVQELLTNLQEQGSGRLDSPEDDSTAYA